MGDTMKINFKIFISLITTFFLFATLPTNAETVKSDNVHVRTWNKFADDVLALHKRIQKKKKLGKTTNTGGYFGNPNFYNEEIYTDTSNGKLVTRLQWERENPDKMHSIEVFIHDKKGRVIRDYAAAYLPSYRNAPTQTLVSFHAYNGNLAAYRTFDASGDRIGERCVGKLKGQDVNFLLDEDEIMHALDGDSDRMEQPDYKACFKGLPQEAGKYLKPQ